MKQKQEATSNGNRRNKDPQSETPGSAVIRTIRLRTRRVWVGGAFLKLKNVFKSDELR